MTAGNWNTPLKSMILSSCSFESFVSFSKRGSKFDEYQAARSDEFLTESGRGLGLRSNSPAATASINRISADTICQASSNAHFEIASGR